MGETGVGVGDVVDADGFGDERAAAGEVGGYVGGGDLGVGAGGGG